MSGDLEVLEERLWRKYLSSTATRFGQPVDPGCWQNLPPPPSAYPEFPSEQWVSYPAGRTLALLLAESLLDREDELSDEMWEKLGLLMFYGGKTRIGIANPEETAAPTWTVTAEGTNEAAPVRDCG